MQRIDLGDNEKVARKNLSKVSYYGDDITIIKAQMGVGKTHHNKQEIKNPEKRTITIIPNYDLLESYDDILDRRDVIVVQGFDQKCVKLDSEEWVMKYKRGDYHDGEKQNVSPGKCCSQLCPTKTERNTCPYHSQWKSKAKNIITVPELLKTVLKAFKHPDVIIVDESLDRFRDLPFNRNDIKKVFEVLYPGIEVFEPEYLIDMPYHEYNYLFESVYEDEYNKAIESHDIKTLNILSKVDIKKIRRYIDLRWKTGYQGNLINEKYLYMCFDEVAKGTHLVITDATFNEKEFKASFDVWSRISGNYFKPSITIYTSSVKMVSKKKEALLINVQPGNNWYKKAFENQKCIIEGIFKMLSLKGKTGLVSNKKVIEEFRFDTAVDISNNYYNIKGSNKFSDTKYFVAAGIPSVDVVGFVRDYNATLLTNTQVYEGNEIIEKEDYYCNKETGKKIGDKNDYPYLIVKYGSENEDFTLQDNYRQKVFAELYQTIGRDRNLISDSSNLTTTFLFGPVTPEIKKERKIVSIDLIDLFLYLSKQPITQLVLVNKIAQMVNFSDEEVAKKLDLWKKRKSDGLNIDFVRVIRRNLYDIKEMLEEDEFIDVEELRFKKQSKYQSKHFMDDFTRYLNKTTGELLI